MSTIDSLSGAVPAPAIAYRRHVWLLRRIGPFILMVLSGGACAAPGAINPVPEPMSWAVPPVRWWREEARRGIAELEAALAMEPVPDN